MTELEKLFDKIYWHADAQGIAQAQILSTFADKDKKIAELEAQVEKMKCCGNCKWYKQGYTDGQRHNKLCLQAAKGEKNWPI